MKRTLRAATPGHDLAGLPVGRVLRRELLFKVMPFGYFGGGAAPSGSANGGGGGSALEVLDEGAGFDPEEVANPLDAENMLKSSGRGIFFMRSFMDDIQLARLPEGGMEVRMVKRLNAES